MKKLSEKGRKILRAIYRGLGVTAVTLVFHSCDGSSNVSSGWGAYGMPPAPKYGMPPGYREEYPIHGKVISKESGEPIPRIHIKIDDVFGYFTDDDGEFYIYAPKQDDYKIIFADIDGIENGGLFKSYTTTLTWEKASNSTESPLIIELEKFEEEAE